MNANPAETPTSRFVTALFHAWQKAGVEFVVLRNYEGLPHFTSNDIDVLLEPAHLSRGKAVLLKAANDSGFRLHNCTEFATLAFFFSDAENDQVHIDLFTDLKWRGFDFLCGSDFLQRKVRRDLFWIPHPADEAAANLLAYMIYTGKVKEKYKLSISGGFSTGSSVAEGLLEKTYGRTLAKRIVQKGIAGEWEALEESTGKLRKGLMARQAFTNPVRTLRSFFAFAARLVRRFLRPPGLIVAICGADGSGKSTVSEKLIENLNATFSPAKGKHFHWKPPLFSAHRSSRKSPATDPHGKPARNAFLSLLYFAFHWLEFVIGSRVCFLPITFKGGLALVDRYYYDFFVDQRRYRLKLPEWLVRAGFVFVKKPDLVLLLDAPAEVLQSRKQEVSVSETERQCESYRKIFRTLANGRIINAATSPEKVAFDAAATILEFMTQRASKRFGIEAPSKERSTRDEKTLSVSQP